MPLKFFEVLLYWFFILQASVWMTVTLFCSVPLLPAKQFSHMHRYLGHLIRALKSKRHAEANLMARFRNLGSVGSVGGAGPLDALKNELNDVAPCRAPSPPDSFPLRSRGKICAWSAATAKTCTQCSCVTHCTDDSVKNGLGLSRVILIQDTAFKRGSRG